MSKLLQYGLVVVLASLLLLGSYRFINAVNEPVPELHLSIKSFVSTGIEVCSRADSTGKYTSNPAKFYLNSSQFFSNIILPVNAEDQLTRVRLDFDNQKNTVMIEKAYLVRKPGGKRDTIHVWKGAALDEIILHYNNIDLETRNESFIQMKCGETDPYLEFNSTLFALYHQNFYKQEMSGWMKWMAAILLTFTCLMLFKKLFASDAIEVIKQRILQGNLLQLAFFLILFSTFFNNQWNLLPDISNKENRKLASKPSMSASRFFEYPELYTSYAKDNYSFRNFFAFVHAVIASKVFHVSPLPDDVIMGKKGWFFDNESNVVNDFRKLQPYNPDQLFTSSQILMQRKNWLTNRHIKFYVIITPNKNRVYPELMPESYTVKDGYGYNFIELLGQHLQLHSNVTLIDPTAALLEAKKKNDVYYSTDTHWNLYGGFIGYRVLIDAMKKDFPTLKPVQENELRITSYFNSEGDLAKMCGLQDVYKRKEYVLQFIDTNKQIRNPEYSSIDLHYSNRHLVDSSQLKLVMFRDSYANYLIPFLNLHFKEANYIWSYEFLDQVIEREKPDVVIFESLQRFMSYAFSIPNSERVVHDTLKH